MAKVIATPAYDDIVFFDYQSEREITDDLPVDVIGECIAEAVNNVWRQGIDPANKLFRVTVTFE